MKRSEVREMIKTAVDALVPVLEFGSGRVSEWNYQPDKTLPQVWQEIAPINGANPNTGAPIDDFSIILHIAKLDKIDSSAKQYEDIIDECDYVAQKLMYQINQVVDGYKLVTVSNRSRTPFVKKWASNLTGVTLTFKINSPDRTDVCTP